MWIPTPIYERIPQFWLLLGLLFLALGLYLGFDFEMIFVYLAIGFVCVGRAIWIQMMRLRYRARNSAPESGHSDAPAAGN